MMMSSHHAWLLGIASALAAVLAIQRARATVEPLSDERLCRWDPVFNVMRCDQ